jgi:hypothetical protein
MNESRTQSKGDRIMNPYTRAHKVTPNPEAVNAALEALGLRISDLAAHADMRYAAARAIIAAGRQGVQMQPYRAARLARLLKTDMASIIM